MDHGGQLQNEGRIMSQAEVAGVDLCDNLPNPEVLPQTRNLNEEKTLTQTDGQSSLQNESLNNNVKNEKEGHKGTCRADNEEDDIDEVMKEEEEESEESSSLINCQSPDTPMTDSSYSDTGSLLETPCPFSPGTSPELTSSVIPVINPETTYPISPLELCQSVAEVEVHTLNPGSAASTMESTTYAPGPAFTSTTVTSASDTRLPGALVPAGIKDATARKANNDNYPCTEHQVSSNSGLITSETVTVTSSTTKLNTSMSATTPPLTFTTGPTSTVSTCSSGPIPSPALLASLEQLAQKGDDTHFPQYLHQIAEAFVLHEDYQLALWCIQLEQLYHQRVLDNLNALQEQWETRCRRTSSNLETQHLDALRDICQTHTRPRATDAVCASLGFLRSTFAGGGALPSRPLGHQVDGGRAEDFSCYQSNLPVTPSINLADRLNSPEKFKKERKDPDNKLKGRARSHGTELTKKEGVDRTGGVADEGLGYTISVRGNELHCSTAGEMDQSKPAEQQGGDLDPSEEKEVDKEEGWNWEEAAKALEMEVEAEDEGEKQRKRDSPPHQDVLPVETLVSGTNVEVEQLHQEAPVEKRQHEELQLHQETEESCLLQEQQGLDEMENNEEEEEEYDEEHIDIFREAATLDKLAKLITIEEMSPASGLVSILKKRSVCEDGMSGSASSEPQPSKPAARRRVRFKVPDDSYEYDVGSGDSCLLLFLLCLVTVVISVGGTALYCALGDVQSSVCQDFSRNADFYIGQIRHVIAQIQRWFTAG
ncbi:consortin [Aulostomus maculatus]